MIVSDVRTIEVGSTNAEVWAHIADRDKLDLTSVTVELATVTPAGVQSAWVAPAEQDRDTQGVIRAMLAITPVVVGWWTLRAKITDGSAVEVLTVGKFQVA